MSQSSSQKCKILKNLLNSSELEFFMEAHNGLSSRIAAEAGFKAIWASGLSISAQLGVRDSNEASWTQIVEVVEFMNDAVDIPILLDGDTGYGNFNNVRRLVKKLSQRGIAGVCIEDKQFPKTNSFIDGEKQPLADIKEFCGRIKAGKDSQIEKDFCLVARVEALIAGWGLDEALERANKYAEAGADAILIHSKRSDAKEIFDFLDNWKNNTPIVIVPTKYYSVPTSAFREKNVSAIIWANHLLRASISAMKHTAETIKRDKSLMRVEDEIVSVAEVFRLQGAEELAQAEKRYLGDCEESSTAIVLAATQGIELKELTSDKPKCMIPISGKPILTRQVEALRKAQIRDIQVVTGYRPEAIDVDGINKLENTHYESTGELASLELAIEKLANTSLILYGDIIFRQYILTHLLEMKEAIIVVVDSSIDSSHSSHGRPKDKVNCTEEDHLSGLNENVTINQFGSKEKVHGEWIGLMKVSGKGRDWIKEAWDTLKKDKDFNQKDIPDLLQQIISNGHPIHTMYIKGHCVNINRLVDVDNAQTFLVSI